MKSTQQGITPVNVCLQPDILRSVVPSVILILTVRYINSNGPLYIRVAEIELRFPT